MFRSVRTPTRTTFLPVQPLSPDLIPAELAVPVDVPSKAFRVVWLPRRVELGERIRVASSGFTGRVIGAVLQQTDIADGAVAALIALYRDEGTDPAAELLVEFREPTNTQPVLPPRKGIGNIFDFTLENT
jgi:hypothetical protein